ncbi:pentapeptide repeat-containing protein [Lentzea sp. NPDC003310]|uniref:NACHT and WD40 repeat domain-containing protein n=1 Tax=Lentzea sp. NPDC003310 TaxID=3154447 RepID=UPI0033A5E449
MSLKALDREAVDLLLDAMQTADELSVEQVQRLLFTQQSPAAATKALERLIKRVNAAATDDHVDLEIQVHGAKKSGARGRTLSFWAERVNAAAAPLREHEAVRDVLIEDRQATVLGPRRIVLCNATTDDGKAGRLWDLLVEALGCDQHGIAVWRSDKDVLAGDDRHQQFRIEVARSELVVVAVSNSWYAQPALGETLHAYSGSSGPTVMPVLLRPTSPRAGAFETGTVYPDTPQGVPFSGLRSQSTQDRWVNGLVEHIHRQLARVSVKPLLDMGTKDRRMLKDKRGDQFFDLHGRPSGMDPDTTVGAHDQERRIKDVVAFLVEWAQDPDSAPLAALLGEYGTGKTITCQELTERLQEAQWDQSRPEPLYFDLRRLGNLNNVVPPLPTILTECINHGWASGDTRLPSGEEVIARAKTVPTLFVIDGLDEVLVRLDTAQGVAFTHELLKLRPIRVKGKDTVHAPFAGVDTKVLLSCRTHYFRSLREQSRHFLEHDRDLATAEDYVGLMLLPLTNEQIRGYMEKALPDEDVTRVMDMLGAVHDLSDLAKRPYTLAKVAAQIPFIEDRLSRQRPVHAATIYRKVLRDWLARDLGKHRLRPDHKLVLMARLAAWSWRRGDRRVDSADLDDWLDEQLATDPLLSRRYGSISRDQLEEDLRTATFVVRSDHGGPDRPDFQFAHSSIHEYFLAQYLCDAIRDDRREDWDLPIPSTETLDFLGQLITDDDDQEALRATLNRWRTPYLEGASELWLRYTLHARAHDHPHPTLVGSDLSGARLRGWHFIGTAANPLVFTAATLVGADVRDTRWDQVNLTHTNLQDARLERAVLHETTIVDGSLRNTNLTGAFLHHCRLNKTDLTGANTYKLRHVHSGNDLPTPQTPVRTRLQYLTGHTDGVMGVAFSPDGTRLATAGGIDGTAQIWDLTTGETLHTLTGHTDSVTGVAFSPDGTRLATASDDGTAQIWETDTGETLHTLTGHTDSVTGVAFSPDGTQLATASDDGTAQIWETDTGETLHTLTDHTSSVTGVAFNPDGTQLATASIDGTAQIWDLTTGETLHTLTDHTGSVRDVAFSPDGTQLATVGGDGARIWDLTTGETLHTLTDHTRSVAGVAFNPDGTRLATVGGDGARIWDLTTGETLHTLTGHTGSVAGVAFSPDGTQLATADDDGAARIWDLTTGETLHTLTGHTGSVRDVAFSPDGTRLATAGGDGARIWDLTTGETLHTLTDHTSSVTGVAFNPDGTRLATVGGDGARIWDLTTGETLHTLTDHTSSVRDVAFSPDGTQLATAGGDGARIWDLTTGETLHTLTDHTGSVRDVAFSPDGTQLATTGIDDTARIWDLTTGETLHTLTDHTSSVTRVAFSPDGTRLATTGGIDGTARIWDLTTGETLHTLTGHTDWVMGVAFNPDGTRLATAGDDGTARIWEADTGQPDLLMATFAKNSTASWSQLTNTLLSTTGDAWLFIRAACLDSQNRVLNLEPFELYYSKPAPTTAT